MQRQRWILVAAGLLVGLVMARADEEKVAIKDLPPAIRASVKAKFPEAAMVAAGKETEDGKTVFEVTVKNNGQAIDITLTPGGAITLLEKTITAQDLPEAVAATLAAKYPKATYKRIEDVLAVKAGKETREFFEVLLVTTDGKRLEVQVLENGKLKNEEKKGKEEKEDKEENEKKDKG